MKIETKVSLVAIALSTVAICLTWQRTSVLAQTPPLPILARSLTLIDDGGEYAKIERTDLGASVVLEDMQKKPRIRMVVSADGSSEVQLIDGSDAGVIRLQQSRSGTKENNSIFVSDNENDSIALTAYAGDSLVNLGNISMPNSLSLWRQAQGKKLGLFLKTSGATDAGPNGYDAFFGHHDTLCPKGLAILKTPQGGTLSYIGIAFPDPCSR
ncbi:MAG: hypothetical protein ACRD20_00750 [Terriglobales bacterium]